MQFPTLSRMAPISPVSMLMLWLSKTQCRLEFGAPRSLRRDAVIASPWRVTMWRSLFSRALFGDEAMRAVCQSYGPQIGGAQPVETAHQSRPEAPRETEIATDHCWDGFQMPNMASGRSIGHAALALPQGAQPKRSALRCPVVR